MGILAVLNLNIIGLSISSGISGKNLFALSILSRISFEASSRFVPQINFNLIIDVPSEEVEVIFSNPGVVPS